MSQKILIIEDEAEAAELLASRLMAAGYEVITAPDATFAIKETHQFKPNLIILDMMLPGGGGAAVLDRLKLSVYTNRIPVLVLTGMGLGEAQKKVEKFGVKKIVQKPYDAQQLLTEIKNILGGRTDETSAKPRILVVDDDPHILDLLNNRLIANGYDVIMASDGEEALQQIKAGKPNLVIADLMMPHLNGWQLGQKIKDTAGKSLPVIVLSALIQQEGKSSDMEVGDFYMAKPFEAEKLIAKVKELLDSRKD